MDRTRTQPRNRPFTGVALALGLGLTALLIGLCGGPADVDATNTVPPETAEGPGNPPEVPALLPLVEAGTLPPVQERLPEQPASVEFAPHQSVGQHGGRLKMLMARAKDVRQLHVYGYARLVAYDQTFNLVPDILESVDIEDGRIFTLHLRAGHRWSDGHPFTAEDFRYWWEDVVLNKELSLAGAPPEMRVDDTEAIFEVLDPLTIRYTWPAPNPLFLPALARPNPLLIYRPAHYLKDYHQSHSAPDVLATKVAKESMRDWVALHFRKDRLYRMDNPNMPSLQPWTPTTEGPADRYVFARNPYFHRVDALGQQLPYVDEVVVTIADAGLIPAKTGAGESDLQGRAVGFGNYTFLKQAAERNDYAVHLWRQATGSHLALYPNLHASDPAWRALLREADFRRALSLGINREEINQVIYYGLAKVQNNTALPGSPLYDHQVAALFTAYDPDRANALLDGLGLTDRDSAGTRLMTDGRPLELVVETAGSGNETADILQLIADSWRKIGVRLLNRPVQVEVLKNRIFAGSTHLSIWKGAENGMITPDSTPKEFVPARQNQYQWPAWGQYLETKGMSGEPIDMPAAQRLLTLRDRWAKATTSAERKAAWQEILAINAEQQYTIGLVAQVMQPVVAAKALRNVPEDGIWNWDPGAHLGLYRPDCFWWDDPIRRNETRVPSNPKDKSNIQTPPSPETAG